MSTINADILILLDLEKFEKPLTAFLSIRHFFGDRYLLFEPDSLKILLSLGDLLESRLNIILGRYQSYYSPWITGSGTPEIFQPVTIKKDPTISEHAYRLLVSSELWANVMISSRRVTYPNENSRILFTDYYGIRS